MSNPGGVSNPKGLKRKPKGHPYSIIFSKVFARELKKSGLSGREFWKSLGYDVPSGLWSYYARGLRSPSLFIAVEIFKKLGLSMDKEFGL